MFGCHWSAGEAVTQAYYQAQLSQFCDTSLVPALGTLSVDQMYIDQSGVVTCEFAELCGGANHSANYQE
jgi:hypothetical protein